MDIMETAAALGQRRSTMAELALAAARAVVDDEAEPDDAKEIYLAYFNGAAKVRTKEQDPGSLKAQVSKFKQVMKLADEREDALELLERVVIMYDAAGPEDRFWPVYRCLTDVAREQRKQPRKLTRDEILSRMRRR